MIEKCVHDLIHKVAQKNPHAEAVCGWDGKLTYKELDYLSSKLAQHLVDLGVQQGEHVPLLFEKSMWTVVAMLATMKSGATFVLLDTEHPEARLRAIVQQLGNRLILASAQKTELAARLAGCVFAVSTATLDDLSGDTKAFQWISNPATALYIVFTSGSSGQPKGVIITHANYVSGACPRGILLGYNNQTRGFDFASYSFDPSIERILCTLIFGGCVCVPSEYERKNDLAHAIDRMKATMTTLTPSIARYLDPAAVPSLRMLILGGELPAKTDIALWSIKTTLINIYGPAECSIATTVNSFTPDTDPRSIGPGIGALMWVVDADDHNRLLPIGSVGELLIEGPIVGQGYLNDPQKTVKAFIEEPEWLLAGTKNHPGRRGRLYKTGDLARRNADGTIHFMGRMDTQAKVRGQRIELEEVESHLRQHLPTDTGVVAEVLAPSTTSGPSTGKPVLVAFLKTTATTENEVSQDRLIPILDEYMTDFLKRMVYRLRQELEDIVPAHMIPSAFVPISHMPITAAGKTDRKMLRELGSSMSIDQLTILFSKVEEPSARPLEEKMPQTWGFSWPA